MQTSVYAEAKEFTHNLSVGLVRHNLCQYGKTQHHQKNSTLGSKHKKTQIAQEFTNSWCKYLVFCNGKMIPPNRRHTSSPTVSIIALLWDEINPLYFSQFLIHTVPFKKRKSRPKIKLIALQFYSLIVLHFSSTLSSSPGECSRTQEASWNIHQLSWALQLMGHLHLMTTTFFFC